MSNDIRTAIGLVVEAGDTIGKQRPGLHGHAENSFKMIGDLWTSYLAHVFAVRGDVIEVLPQDVARMMEMLKIARSIYGDPDNRDNFVDSIGYAALAGMMQLPHRPFEQQQEQDREIEDGKKSIREQGSTHSS